MQRYIGTKIINAEPMNRQKYNDFRGWELPEDEDGMDEGYLVEYLDGGKPNTEKYEGYVSWSPKEQFEKAYRQSDTLSFGLALEALKDGKRIARKGCPVFIGEITVERTLGSLSATAGKRAFRSAAQHMDSSVAGASRR